MKAKLLSILLLLIVMSCSDNDNNDNLEQTNKVLLLQVDFMTNVFEGGKEFAFDANIESFTISSNYQAPGDFGNIALYYDELDEILFDGSIIWMGTGQREYPENLMDPDDFENNSFPVAVPSETDFENVMYSAYAYYPETIDYNTLWNAIDNLQLVTDYRKSNPDSKIHLFLYTPSVGVGDPNEWDWIVFMKN